MNRKKIFKVLVFLILVVWAVISLYPLLWVIFQSFKTESQFLSSIWTLPTSLNLDNFAVAFEKGHLGVYLTNTIRNTFITVAVELIFITLAGYAFAKMKMKFRKFFWYFILLNMLIPTPIILLPMYMQVVNLGIQNTLPAIVFPYYQGFAPLGLLLLTNYMRGIPEEITEAARIDGCGTGGILWRIMVPLVKPMLVTLGILGGMSAWNEFLWALVSISDTEQITLSVGISSLRDQTTNLG